MNLVMYTIRLDFPDVPEMNDRAERTGGYDHKALSVWLLGPLYYLLCSSVLVNSQSDCRLCTGFSEN